MLHCCCGCCCIAVLLYLWYNSVVRLSQAEERPSSSHTSGPVPYLSTKGSEKNVRITVVVATVFVLLLLASTSISTKNTAVQKVLFGLATEK